MAIVTLQDIHVAFGPEIVLDHLDLQLHPGEKVGMVGANGSGKTTILRLITGQVTPDMGRVIRQKGLRIGYLPQEATFSGERTVLEEMHAGVEELFKLQEAIHERLARDGASDRGRAPGQDEAVRPAEPRIRDRRRLRIRDPHPDDPGGPGLRARAAPRQDLRPQRRTALPAGTGPGPHAPDRSAAARRADEPPGPPGHRMAGAIPGQLSRGRGRHQPRPVPAGPGRVQDHRGREPPGQGLARQLQQLRRRRKRPSGSSRSGSTPAGSR